MKVVFARGQILILVLLIVVVALAVGLSVAARNITNLRTSAQTEQSQRAFTAAEGGVEDVLSRLSTVAIEVPLAGGSKDYPVDVGDLKANVNVKSSNTYQSTIDLGNVGQINLDTMAAGSVLSIEWGKGQVCDSAGGSEVATIGVTQYASDGTQERKVYGCGFASGRSEEGALDTASGCTGDGYAMCTQISTIANAKFMRIRPFWKSTVVRVSGATIPQTYDITSTAQVVPAGTTTSGGVTRTVRLQRTALPQLPAVFDYVLFSSGDISKGGP